MTAMRANKLEAARRLIDAAIRMLLGREDPLAVYAIAYSSFNVLRDLSKTNSQETFLKRMMSNIQPGMEGKFWKEMNKTWNFLKHADSDPAATLENVEEEVNEAILFLATQLYNDITHKLSPEMIVLVGFFSVLHPELMLDANPLKSLVENLEGVRRMSRREQLQLFNSLLSFTRSQVTS
jgi:hypothetical protein